MKLWLIFLFACLLLSCNPFEPKPLDVITVKKNGITARWFITSTTTIHSHVEVQTKKGWRQVLEANVDANGIDKAIHNVIIDKDTVIIQAEKGIHIYEFTSLYWGIHIKVDTTRTFFE